MSDTLPPTDAMQKLLASMPQLEASDLHLKVGYAPFFRVAGQLRKVDMTPIADSAYMEAMFAGLIPDAKHGELDEHQDVDFSARIAGGDRFRINLFRSAGEMHAAIRRVQSKIPSFQELHLPEIYAKTVGQCVEGLVLVSGITGCGKSSTLAAMVRHINETRSVHIVTIEDPIEYVFKPHKSIISQREIGIDTPDFAEALRCVVRQDPDCILIGEMRDRETMLAGLQAAETGHLVLGSIHCSDAQQTFSRILEFFPRSDHAFIRSSLANSLQAIMCQKLVPGIEPNSRFPATEVLLNNSVVREKIIHEQDDDIPSLILQCAEEGMRSFTLSLCELIESEDIHYDTAMEMAPNRDGLASMVKGIKAATPSLVGKMRGGR